jgi:methyl-accepting chemotaxis protein
LAIIADSTQQMEELFHQMCHFRAAATANSDEAAIARKSPSTRRFPAGPGDGESGLFTQAANEELARVKRTSSLLILAAVLAALGGSGLLSVLLHRDIVGDLDHLRRGTEIIAAGDLSHRVAPRRTEELGRLAEAFNAMTARRLTIVKDARP